MIGRMKRAHILSLIVVLLHLLVSACSEKVPENIGVFYQTDKNLVEMQFYGEQTGQSRYEIRYAITETEKGIDFSVPDVDRIDSFVVNMPDVKIMNSQIYWVSANDLFDVQSFPERKRFSNYRGKTVGLGYFTSDKHIPVKSDIKHIKNNVYKITCVEMKNNMEGCLVLKIGMSLGTPDRIYIFQRKTVLSKLLMSAYSESGYNAAANSDIRNARTYLEAHYADYRKYPDDISQAVQLSRGVVVKFTKLNDNAYLLKSYHSQGSIVYSTSSTDASIIETRR